jgi:hypothetical protein
MNKLFENLQQLDEDDIIILADLVSNTTASDFYDKLSAEVKSNYLFPIAEPEVGPLRDGSVDIFWDLPHCSLLVNCSKEEINLYGQDNDGYGKIKMRLEASELVGEKFESLVLWSVRLKN